MKILTVVGARPQFVKAAVVSRAFADVRPNVREVIVHTGQHYDANMSDVFFDELQIPRPQYHLGIGGGTHGQNTGRMIEHLEQVILKETPDWVLVYGDTDTTLAGALAAVKLHVPVAHVEAGLRSFNRKMPEEVNRVLVDHASDRLFTPTDRAMVNLKREGLDQRSVLVGDVMYDATLFYAAMAERSSDVLERLRLHTGQYLLLTLHRQENTDDEIRLRDILQGLASAPLPVLWPLHPRTRKRLQEFGLALPDTIRIIEPVGYLDMLMLEKNAGLIVTDSGGVQKEAYFHSVRCLILRDETEWAELVDTGASSLVGADPERIEAQLNGPRDRVRSAGALYGDGNAGRAIAQTF